MSRFSDKRVTKPTQDELWNEFCDLVVRLRSREAVRRFFCDLLNRGERLMLARRLHIASLLEADLSYREIKKILHVGTATIARVHRWLEFGRDGYRRAVRTLDTHGHDQLKKKYGKYYSSNR